ncbi:MAG: T9SS type A sorting domain-containing protein [Flavobacteriales bacterium]|nr:T9SS type A sorting domain-containing protein [Flavobacteriales bacterium]
MKIRIKNKALSTLWMLILGTTTTALHGQVVNTYAHPGTKMHVFSQDTVTVFGNATNYGSWGSVEGGVVHFYGITFKNDNAATMPGAGQFYFQQPRPAPYARNGRQNLEGGYDWATSAGCSFPDIKLYNSRDLYLINDDSKVRDTFTFVDGHVIHGGMDFTVGDNDPGEILGYNETQFFVTNGNPTDTEGFLERESLATSDAEEAYPIGHAKGDYTPGRIKNTGTDDDYSMRVFLNTFDAGRTGTNQDDVTVARTWDVEERTTGGSNVTLELQHNVATEGSTFASKRTNHYITHHVGSSPNGPANGNGVDTISQSEWDLLKYSNLYGGESGTGYITTGTAISTALVTKRANLSAFSPYTKTVYSLSPLPVELVYFDAEWSGNNALVNWQTATELNNRHFVVERSFDGKTFEQVGIVKSLADGGNSSQSIDYQFVDKGVKSITTEVVYYQLVQVDFDGKAETFGPEALFNKKTAAGEVMIYPNPTSGSINIVKTDAVGDIQNVEITNIAGQVVSQFSISNEQLRSGYKFTVFDVPTGIYFIRISNGINSTIGKISIDHSVQD